MLQSTRFLQSGQSVRVSVPMCCTFMASSYHGRQSEEDEAPIQFLPQGQPQTRIEFKQLLHAKSPAKLGLPALHDMLEPESPLLQQYPLPSSCCCVCKSTVVFLTKQFTGLFSNCFVWQPLQQHFCSGHCSMLTRMAKCRFPSGGQESLLPLNFPNAGPTHPKFRTQPYNLSLYTGNL